MAVFRVDLHTDDPQPVFQWIETHVPKACVVRAVAYKTVRGWYMKRELTDDVRADRLEEEIYP